jgi:hypothetical protein
MTWRRSAANSPAFEPVPVFVGLTGLRPESG